MDIGTIMLKTLYEGYIPCIIMAALGHSLMGGSLLAWAAFVWIFGAVLTVAVAMLRTQTNTSPLRTRPVTARIENC